MVVQSEPGRARSIDTDAGDPACWAHLSAEELSLEPPGVVVDLGRMSPDGEDSLCRIPTDCDLEAGVVRLDAGHGTGDRMDPHSDVLLVVRSGSGELTIDDHRYGIRPDVLAVIPRGCPHSIAASVSGLTYLVVRPLPAVPPPSPLAVLRPERVGP